MSGATKASESNLKLSTPRGSTSNSNDWATTTCRARSPPRPDHVEQQQPVSLSRSAGSARAVASTSASAQQRPTAPAALLPGTTVPQTASASTARSSPAVGGNGGIQPIVRGPAPKAAANAAQTTTPPKSDEGQPRLSPQTPPPASTPSSVNVDSVIHRLLSVCELGGRLTRSISLQELMALCQLAKAAFLAEASLVEILPPLIVCGDIHGQYSDLLRIYNVNGFPPEANYLFLGDYVDRGSQSLETIALQFSFKIKFPSNVVLLRGNHETFAVNRVYGFFEECNRRYRSVRLWMSFQEAFNCMPLCARIGGRVLCMHGGLSPRLSSIKQLRNIRRPLDPITPSMEIDLLWSDPGRWVTGWGANTRGAAYTFGVDTVTSMCTLLGLDLIVRAHQVVQDGYEFFAGRRLVTVFSAPNYCGQFNNAGATMLIDQDMRCAFQVYKPESKAVRLALATKRSPVSS